MMKVLRIEELTGPIPLPGLFVRFIGVAEVLGATALIPLVVGMLSAFVAYGRSASAQAKKVLPPVDLGKLHSI